MNVKVTKLSTVEDMHRAIESTVLEDMDAKISLEKMYDCEHSPIRTHLFLVEVTDVYSYLSTHLVRHSAVGQQHYVSSRREDRGGGGEDGRYSLVKHMMILNAQHLIDMSRKRLCYQSSTDTFRVMHEIRMKVSGVDPALAKFMMPNCEYRRGCHELKSCGYYKEDKV